MRNAFRLILASGSPRRRGLLREAGYDFGVITSHAAESSSEKLEPHELAMENARAKAEAVARGLASEEGAAPLVIGADTIVVLDGHVFGKPAGEQEARETLRSLSGRSHEVITGVCLVHEEHASAFSETTEVFFKDLDESVIDAYIATGEPMDKAGAYGIQGEGGKLVDHIVGDYDNVVGLPVKRVASELEKLGIRAGNPA